MFEKHRLQRHLVHTVVSEQNLHIHSFRPSIVMASSKTFSTLIFPGTQDFFCVSGKPSGRPYSTRKLDQQCSKKHKGRNVEESTGIATGHTHTAQNKNTKTHLTLCQITERFRVKMACAQMALNQNAFFMISLYSSSSGSTQLDASHSLSGVELCLLACPFLFFSLLSGFPNSGPYFGPHVVWSSGRLNF